MKRRGAPPYPRALRGDRLTVAKPRRSSREFRWGENAHPYHRIVPDWSGFLTPWVALGASPWRREESCRRAALRRYTAIRRGHRVSRSRSFRRKSRSGRSWPTYWRRPGCRGPPSCHAGRVRGLERWRDVRAWWDEETRTDRFTFRVLLVGCAVAELALERSGGWLLVGVAD